MKINKDFKAYIEKNSKKCNKTSCWNWIKSKDPGGYGQSYNGVTVIKAHRLSFLAFSGVIPDDFCVLHTCDNSGCVNPEHLFLGTMADNMIDRSNKGRAIGPKAEKNSNSKLKRKDIKEIKRLYFSEKVYQKDIAKKYGVSQVTISNVVLGKLWN